MNVQKTRCRTSASLGGKQGLVNNSSHEVTFLHKNAGEQFTAEPRDKGQLSWRVGSAARAPRCLHPLSARNSASALQVSASTSTRLPLTNGQGLAATSEFCFSMIILFIALFPGPSLRWGCVSRQSTVCEALETRALAPGDAHHPARSLDIAQPAVTFHPCECWQRAPAAGARAVKGVKKPGQDEGRRPWSALHPLGCPTSLAWLSSISCQKILTES